MKKVITYGTFDLLHFGHLSLLERAKELGDYLIVGVTSDSYDKERGKLNVHDSLLERIEAVKATGLADEIIIEEFEGQKILDIQKYDIDIFTVGSDWTGEFDYLEEYCDVVYLERTKGVSSTELRNGQSGLLRIGIIGSGRIATRFIPEARLVSGVEVVGVFNRNLSSAKKFQERHCLEFGTNDLSAFYSKIDAAYIASPHQTHYQYTMDALHRGVHVLCEKPMSVTVDEVRSAYELARNKGLALVHGVKTAFFPAFERLQILAKGGRIGKIVGVDASFSKLVQNDTREMAPDGFGGSFLELAPYPLFAVARLLGHSKKDSLFFSIDDENGTDVFTRGIVLFDDASAGYKVGLKAKTEGDMVITGTRGYIYVPAPWWKTDYFEMRFEDSSEARKFFYAYDGDGLRYEIYELLRLIQEGSTESPNITEADSVFIAEVIEQFRNEKALKH